VRWKNEERDCCLRGVVPMGGGAVAADGGAQGTLGTTTVTSIDVAAKGAEILIQ
jgi:hypothetical protein